MSSISNSDDPHGYRRLYRALHDIEQRLLASGDVEGAGAVHSASMFYGGSPTEFLGEARLALQTIAAHEGLPDGLMSQVNGLIEEINEGFRRVGS
jgi:hypothetical protein